jgi:hypothetical protein
MPWERARRLGGWVKHRTGLDNVERRNVLPLPELELQSFVYPACSQSLIPTALSHKT